MKRQEELHRFLLQAIDAEIAETLAIVEAVLANRKSGANLCPKCDAPSIEIFSTEHPTGYTGIYRCPNSVCRVDLFDPTLPEVIQ